MTVLLFIAVLVVLILVHEFGHFAAAKLSGMRVDEFGVGFPPRIWGKRIGETLYTVNALPFGGFVKIHGEDETDAGTRAEPRAFAARPRLLQAFTLVAGVAMNWLLAFVVITGLLIAGTPRALAPEEVPLARDARLVVASVAPGTPAADAGLAPGDEIRSIAASDAAFASADADAFLAYLGARAPGEPLAISVANQDDEVREIQVALATGVIPDAPERPALGISVATVGTVPVPLLTAPYEGLVLTWELTKATAAGLGAFLWDAVTLDADLSQVSGPVGIAGAVGNAYADGVAELLFLAAIISLNLAIINLLPLPALDGGRLVFVGIEAITRRPVNARFAAVANGLGFALLILLMLVVTVSDVFKLI